MPLLLGFQSDIDLFGKNVKFFFRNFIPRARGRVHVSWGGLFSTHSMVGVMLGIILPRTHSRNNKHFFLPLLGYLFLEPSHHAVRTTQHCGVNRTM